MAETLEQYKQRIASAGGRARAAKLTKAERKAIGRVAAAARWSKQKKEKSA
jgi:hypothetical protein